MARPAVCRHGVGFPHRADAVKIQLLLVCLLATGCAVFEDPLEREIESLHTPEMEAAIQAARAGDAR